MSGPRLNLELVHLFRKLKPRGAHRSTPIQVDRRTALAGFHLRFRLVHFRFELRWNAVGGVQDGH